VGEAQRNFVCTLKEKGENALKGKSALLDKKSDKRISEGKPCRQGKGERLWEEPVLHVKPMKKGRREKKGPRMVRWLSISSG